MTVRLLVVLEDVGRVQESTGSREVRVPVDRGTGRVSHERAGGVYPAAVDAKSEIREFLTSRRNAVASAALLVPARGARGFL
jgi:hypothetical protein